MKAVLIAIAIAGLLVVSVRAQECSTPSYTEEIVPKCLSNKKIQLPNYANPTQYYDCSTGTPVLTNCVAPRSYFSYVLQECSTCANYIPAPECSQNKLGLECQPIDSNSPNTPSSPTTSVSTTDPSSTTSEPTTDPSPTTSEPTTDPSPTTSEPTTDPSPTTSEPTTDPSPTTSEPTTDPSISTEEPTGEPTIETSEPTSTTENPTTDGNFVSDTTVYVPPPPSPNDPNVPAPPSPAPTAPTVATGPPVVQ